MFFILIGKRLSLQLLTISLSYCLQFFNLFFLTISKKVSSSKLQHICSHWMKDYCCSDISFDILANIMVICHIVDYCYLVLVFLLTILVMVLPLQFLVTSGSIFFSTNLTNFLNGRDCLSQLFLRLCPLLHWKLKLPLSLLLVALWLLVKRVKWKLLTSSIEIQSYLLC